MHPDLIKRIEIKELFHQYDLKWDLNPDVNILVGINGIGKTTILRTINALFSQKCAYIKDWEGERGTGCTVHGERALDRKTKCTCRHRAPPLPCTLPHSR